jgi:AraC-like DNA-binding protein
MTVTQRSLSRSEPHLATSLGQLVASDTNLTLREKRYPPLRIAIAVQTLVESGLSESHLLDDTGLDMQALADPDTRVSSLQLLNVVRNAVRLSCGTDAGLRIGLRYHASCYGMLGYAVLCSATMRQAFDTTVRYNRLGNSMLDAQWIETPESAIWVIPSVNELRLPDMSPALYWFVRDMCLAAYVTVFKDVMGAWCIPLKVSLTGSQPPHADLLAHALGCPLEFNQKRNELHYPATWLERAPQLANPITAAQISNTCSRMLEEFKWQSGITRRVYHELTCTPGRFPEIEAVAATLCMTSRTLRRKLEAEGTSYTDLLDNVRHALAMDFLNTSALGVDDIAAALGFSDSASFRRAFKRWTGKSPTAFRG